MSTYRQMKIPKEPDDILKKRRTANITPVAAVQSVYPAGFQRTTDNINSLSPANVLQLQRTVGNRAVERLLENRAAKQTAKTGQQSIQRSLEEEDELVCPGSKIRSGGQ